MAKLSKERIGEMFILGEMTLYSLFPIIISYATKLMPPILFAGTSILVTGLVMLLYFITTKQLNKLKNKEAILNILGITLFIVIIPSILIFIGTSLTSGINTSLLLQSEIVFTFILYAIFKYEKITTKRFLGAFLILFGTFAILFNGKAQINIGDIMIIAGTFFYPIGNIFAKRALKVTTPATIIFVRNIIGGPILIATSLLFENYNQPIFQIIGNFYPYILLSGILIYCVSKLLWYEGLSRIDVNKAVLISVGGYPAISLFFAYIFLKEIPTVFQWAGFILILGGLLTISVRRNLKNPQTHQI